MTDTRTPQTESTSHVIAHMLGDDGTTYETVDGRTLLDLVEAYSGRGWTLADTALQDAYDAACEDYPCAALYIRAQVQERSTSWSDPVGKAAAARRAIELLGVGAPIEDCRDALARRTR